MVNICKEIDFWTRIMRDHGQFQYTNLSPNETDAIYTASYFMNLFERLHHEASTCDDNLPDTMKYSLISANIMAVTQFIEFKKMMLTRLMKCNIELNMVPSFLNHMINEALEYYRVLCIAQGTMPYNKTLENIRLHKIWLPDASGHASAIAAELDAIESEYVHEARDFVKKFDNLFKKAYEMYKMFERTGLENGGLYHFNDQVIKALEEFITYLEKIEKLRAHCKVYATGTTSPLVPNHMIREEKYYIYKIRSLEE